MDARLALGAIPPAVYSAGYHAPIVLRTGLLFGLGVNWFLGVWIAVEAERLRGSRAWQAAARGWPLVLATAIVGFHRGLPIQGAYLVSGLAFALMMVRLTTGPASTRPVVEPAWATASARFVGLSSYPIYLSHAPFLVLLSTIMAEAGWAGDWRLTWAILSLASIAVGSALGWFAERPIMRWRADLLARVRSGGPVVPASVPGLLRSRRVRQEGAGR